MFTPKTKLRLISSLLALGQLLFFVAPVQAQVVGIGQPQPNYWYDSRGVGYYRGTGGIPALGGYSPHTTGPQWGYAARSYGHPPSTGLGMGIGLGMMGGMVGVGGLMMASQMISRRNMYKNHNNPNANQPKDKKANADRRHNQELKIKGELDRDYQKELSEKGGSNQIGQMPSAPSSMGGQGMGGQPFAPGQNMGQGFSPAVSPSISPPANSAMNAGMSQPAMAAPAVRENMEGEVLNPVPWSPSMDSSQPSF